MVFLVSMTMVIMVMMVNVTSAPPPPDPYFWVDPASVTGYSINDPFLIYIRVIDVPNTYAWQVSLSWDPNTVEWSGYKVEGDFLKRSTYGTTGLAVYPATPEQANIEGKLQVGSALSSPYIDPWASGDGELFRLGFTVKDDGSCLLNLFETFLHDNQQFPWLYTYYPNHDSFFYNVDPSHDIRITDVTVLTPEVLLGEVANINVTVLNEGTETETDFTLNVYANETLINSTLLSLNGAGDFEDRSLTYEASWNTTGFAGGIYTISANVTDVSGEVDTADNNFTDGEVEVVIPVHDIAIDYIQLPIPPHVYVGKNATIYVGVENQGHFNETFDVTLYYDSTTIETKTVTDLGGQTLTSLTFKWNTTSVAEDTYTIKAEASVVPGEIETGDNLLIDGTLHVKIGGDVNGDGTVDASDLFRLGKAYESMYLVDPNWDPDCDFNSDLMIDALDLSILDENYGRSE